MKSGGGGLSCILDLFSFRKLKSCVFDAANSSLGVDLKTNWNLKKSANATFFPPTSTWRSQTAQKRPRIGKNSHHQHLPLRAYARPQVQLTSPLRGPGPTKPNTPAMFTAEKKEA